MSDLYREIFKLKKLERTGWKLSNIKGRTESDAEHTFSTIMLALEIMNKCENNLDQLKVLKMIAYHEIGEIDVGDITLIDTEKRKHKYEDEKKCIQRIALKAQMPEIYDLWIEFEENKTDEARFVKLLDRYDGVLQAKIYSEEDNRPELFEEFFTNAKKQVEEMESIIKKRKFN